ncbi:hypothetical protein F53441_8792 [Fusarium austroafricanum]|uniref:Uncharacterized protein n=1 Tax=Fusarium austroafricanum TaxID=2364996 RepID=A0A8H4KAJ4_9HYPO|nr:hypothetical protein F53441_8792 [Fusarium austroafricanum]
MSFVTGDDSKHNRLRTQCGICSQALLAGVSFVPLLGSEFDPESACCLDRTVFPDYRSNNLSLGGKVLCWAPNCYRCADAPEAVGIHSDCLGVFQEHCKVDKALDRLWTTVGQRNLWKGAPTLQLDREMGLEIDIVREKGDIYGVRLLKLLPAELIHMIREYSESATFWRYILVLSLARELSHLQSDVVSPITSMPLCNVLAWTRGDSAALLSRDCPPFLRLTLDSRGIRKIERFWKRPKYEPGRSDKEAFVITHQNQLENIATLPKVEFSSLPVIRANSAQFNVLRLQLPEPIKGFQIWDTPNPPHLEDCEFYGRVSQSMQFKTIDLRSVTGLTFFFSFSKLYAVHAHTQSRPYATRTFERLPARRQENVVWIYLPMPRDEEITAIAMRLKNQGGGATTQKPFFLIRTKLAGDVSVGPCHLGPHRDVVMSQSNPKLLIYSAADVGPATVFGTYPRERPNGEDFPSFRHPWSTNPPIHEHVNLSSAPLKDVSHVQVLEDEETGFCKAIILDYENGARRALGNCRLGIDRVKAYLEPSRLCYRPAGHASGIRRDIPAVRVEAGSDSNHQHDEEGWVCSAMEGVVEFWFSREQSVVRRIVEDTEA